MVYVYQKEMFMVFSMAARRITQKYTRMASSFCSNETDEQMKLCVVAGGAMSGAIINGLRYLKTPENFDSGLSAIGCGALYGAAVGGFIVQPCSTSTSITAIAAAACYTEAQSKLNTQKPPSFQMR
jgi:hypothetical protein